MIIWLNGTFGVGKTTTSAHVATLVPGSRVFDTEHVGYMLRIYLTSEPVGDFQDWQPWRSLVVETASQILDYVGGVLVVPQSVLVEQYWTEIRVGLEKANIPVRHFVLHADRDTITSRIDEDAVEAGARQWRLDHLDAFDKAWPWLSREGDVVDTTNLTPDQAAQLITESSGTANAQ